MAKKEHPSYFPAQGKKKLLMAALLFCCWLPLARAQQKSLVILPPGYNASQKYPVVFLLPGVGGTSLELAQFFLRTPETSPEQLSKWLGGMLYAFYPKQVAQYSFILVLPPGKGSLAKGFDHCLKNTETLLKSELELLKKNYAVNEKKVIVAGFSLGGDLSFALHQRQPQLFSGALVMSSRCSFRGDTANTGACRFFLTMGQQDFRQASMKTAKQWLDKNKMVNEMLIIPDSDHFPPPSEEFLRGIIFAANLQ